MASNDPMRAKDLIVNLLKKFNEHEVEKKEILFKAVENIDNYIERAYLEAQNIFTKNVPNSYPKTPSTTRKAKRRLESEGDKENKRNKYNDESTSKLTRKSNRMIIRKSKVKGNTDEESESFETGPDTRRFTRLQAKCQSTLDNSKLPATPETIKLEKKLKVVLVNLDDIPKTEVLKKVKEYEEKFISPVAQRSPAVKVDEDATTTETYVSTLSPVKLFDPKLQMTPIVVCTPIKDKSNEESEKKSMRRSSQKRIKGSVRKSQARKSSGLNRISVKHGRRSNRLTITIATKKIESKSDSEEEIDDEDIPKTPTPPQTKKTRKVLTKTHSTKRIKNSSSVNSSCKKKIQNPRCKTPVSASKSSKTSERFVSPKLLEATLIRQRQEKLDKKEVKVMQTQIQREQRLKQQIEENKRRREMKMQKALDKRHQQEEERIQHHLVRSSSKDRQMEKFRSTPSKKSERLREKKIQAEERRSKEEEIRKIKLLEKEEEYNRYIEQARKKKEMELLKRQELLAEQRKKQLEKEAMKEEEGKRRIELLKERMQKEEEAKKKEMELRRLKELQRQAAERDKQRERERIERERIEYEKLVQKEREKTEIERLLEKEKRLKESKTDKLMNTTYETSAILMQNSLNSTYTGSKAANTECYDMTPEVVKPKPLKDPNNYDIAELCSEDSTDDESNPRKYIPTWAQSRYLRAAMLAQEKFPPDLDELFQSFEPPDLSCIFKKKRSRFLKRTSSANWSSPVYRHNISGYLSS